MELNRLKQICLIILFLTFSSYSANAQSAESLVSPFTGSVLLGTYEAKFAPLTLLVEPLDVKNNPST
ncbi:MAG: hypothetical protein OQJ81_08795, partial [Melioribacteraceae bacterium]|nr:hypothetical protein [Melioribacteraceae bacterium]